MPRGRLHDRLILVATAVVVSVLCVAGGALLTALLGSSKATSWKHLAAAVAYALLVCLVGYAGIRWSRSLRGRLRS